MKKKLFILLLCLAAGVATLQAQGRHQLEAYIGGPNSEALTLLSSRGSTTDLYALYEPQTTVQSDMAVYSLDYMYSLNKWIRLGAQMDIAYIKGKSWYKLGNKPANYFEKNMLYALPQFQCMVPGLKHLRPYGRLALGVQVNIGSYKDAPVRFAYDIVPLGIEWGGQRIYGTAELAYGSIIQGVRIGIGCRF